MSVETLPEYPDLFTLPIDEIKIIEEKCIKRGHLDKNITLLEQINLDKKVLDAYNLSKEDIYRNHRNMYLKFINLDKFDAYTDVDHGDHHQLLLDNLPPRFGQGWCPRLISTNEIELNGQKLRITLHIWGGAEQCAIENYFSTEYHGHDRGDRDWFVSNLDTNEKIWIPDLLPAQVGMFGFFQSSSSAYRLDPEQYIKVMGLKNKVELFPVIKNMVWGLPSGPFEKDYLLKDAEIIGENKDEMYNALLIRKENKIILVVHFNHYSKETLKIHYKSNTINIFDRSFEIDYIFNFDNYLECYEHEQIKLVEGDDTDKIKSKRNQRCVIC